MWVFEETTAENDFRTVFEWYRQMPAFLKQKPEWQVEDVSAFIDKHREGDAYKALNNGKMQGFVYTTDMQVSGITEGHLYCDSEVAHDLLIGLLLFAKQKLFAKGFHSIVCCVHKRHQTLKQIVSQAGFTPTGYKSWNGIDIKGRIFETEIFITLKR